MQIGMAGILKPRRSSMGRGIRIVHAEEDSSQAWHEVSGEPADNEPCYIYEQLMDGVSPDGWLAPFVSVDTLSVGSERLHFGLFDKLPLLRDFVETGDIGPSGLSSQMKVQVLSVVERALSALGVVDRVTHTEVRLTSTGPQVLEVNGRLGGYVQGLCRALTGTNPVRMALAVAAGHAPRVPALPDASGRGRYVAAVQIPLDTSDPAVATKAIRALRACTGVQAVETPDPVHESLRYAGAWLEAATRHQLIGAVVQAVDEVCRDPAIRGVLDTGWLAALHRPSHSPATPPEAG
jgi:biotin carboxylase